MGVVPGCQLLCPMLLTPWPCSPPVVDPRVRGVHTADMIVSPPTLGGPFDYLNLTICIAGTDICFVHQCLPVTSPTSNCTVTSADCADTATDCLRAGTNYTVSAVAVRPDGQTSLVSNVAPFEMPRHT